MRSRYVFSVIAAVVLSAALLACGGGGGTGAPKTIAPATVNVHVSDPPTCSSGSGGPFSHIFVTITGVRIHTSATAPDNDPGWIDLITLGNSPRQVDLLAVAGSQCFLADLGSVSLQPGIYQQMRLILASSAANVTNNQCGSAGANCVVLAADPTNPRALDVGSASQTGIKIPSGQIAGGQFTIASGQTKDLNIDFDGCASIVTTGSGSFRLKPVLHAGEVSLTASSITGKVIDRTTAQPIVGGRTIVALEQRDSAGVVQVKMQTTPDANGNFSLCPVPAGIYDVVIASIAVNANVVTTYAPTITLNVQPGNTLGNVPMTAVTGASTAPASITGRVTTQNAASPAGAAPTDVTLAVLQQAPVSGTTNSFIIPLAQQSSATAVVSTTADVSCPAGVACANYTLSVPAAGPAVGTFSASGTTYSDPVLGIANYTIRGEPALSCTPATAVTSPVSVSPGGSSAASALTFNACQ